MKKLTKVLLLLLSVAIVCAGLVVISAADSATVARIGNKEYATFTEAFEAAKTGETITLLGDVTLTESYDVNKDIVINLAGNTLKESSADPTFILMSQSVEKPKDSDSAGKTEIVQAPVSFTITGKGDIVSNGGFILSETSESHLAPVVNIMGDKAPIYIDYAAEGASFISTLKGTYNFKNLEISVTDITSTESFLAMSSDKAGANVYFDTVYMKGNDFENSALSNKDTSRQQTGLVWIQGKGYANVKNSTLISNVAVFKVNGSNTDGTVIEAYNSQLINRANSDAGSAGQTGAIGTYASNFSGKIILNDSLIEGSYRPVLVYAAPTAELILNNSILKHSGRTQSELVRDIAITVNEGSSLVGSFVFSHLTYNGVSTVTLREGARFSPYIYNLIMGAVEKENIFVAEKTILEDGSEGEELVLPSELKTLKFAYDPIGDSDAPFVLTSKYETDADGDFVVDADGNYIETNNINLGTIAYASTAVSLTEDLIWKSYYNAEGKAAGTSVNASGAHDFPQYLWNPGGEIYGETYDGNTSLKYYQNEVPNNFTMSFSPVALEYNAYKVIVYEIEFATDSEYGFAPFSLSINMRKLDGTDPKQNKPSLGINNNGILTLSEHTAPAVDGVTEFALNTDTWNRVTVVMYMNPENEAFSLSYPTAEGGKAYYYLNGQLIATSSALYPDTAKIYGPRADIRSNSNVGASTLFDNIMVRTYDEYMLGESYDIRNPEQYLYNGGNPISTETINPLNDVSVAGLPFGSIPEAIEFAEQNDTYVTLRDDIVVPQKIDYNCLIYANGYSLALTEDSYKSNISSRSDGTVYSYAFDKSLGSLGTVTIRWFMGDVSDPAQLRDESKYVISECGLSEIPTYPGAAIKFDQKKPIIDKESCTVYRQLGWSTVIGAETAVPLVPLSLSDVINNVDGAITYYPVLGYETLPGATAVVVLDKDGAYSRSYDYTGFYGSQWTGNNVNAGVKLAYGETLIFLKDVTFAVTAPMGVGGSGDKVYNLDLNGHKVTIDNRNNGTGGLVTDAIKPGASETLNIYSSLAGASIVTKGGYAAPSSEDYTLKTGYLLVVDKDNSEINIGTVTNLGETYPGSNIDSISGSVIANAKAGTKSSINIDVNSIVLTSNEGSAMFISGDSTSSINVKNSVIVMAAPGGTLAAGITAEKAASVLFEGCTIIADENGKNLIGKMEAGKKVIFNNCVTNGFINGSGEGEVIIGDLTAFNTPEELISERASLADGCSELQYNQVMQIPGGVKTLTFYYTISHNTKSYSNEASIYKNELIITYNPLDKENLSDLDFTVAVDGKYTINSIEQYNVVMPTLNTRVVSAENTISVTYYNLYGEVAEAKDYAIGAVWEAPVIEEKVSVSLMTLTHLGTFTEIKDETGKYITYKPDYTAVATAEGIKVNMSLYTNFNVNLYIPEAYKNDVSGVFVNGVSVSLTEKELENKDKYLVATSVITPDKADESVVFTVLTTYMDESYEATFTVSLASYAEKVFEGAANESEQRLVYSALAYAQAAVAYNSGAENEEIAELLESKIALATSATNYGKCFKTEGLGKVFVKVNVRLESSPAFVFTVRSGFEGLIKVNGVDYNFTADTSRELVIENMSISDFTSPISIAVNGTLNGNAVTIENGAYSLSDYRAYHVANAKVEEGEIPTLHQEKSAEALELIDAIFDYAASARRYLNLAEIQNPFVEEVENGAEENTSSENSAA